MTRPEQASAGEVPQKNRRVVARLVGYKDHSGAEWRRQGWGFMVWWGSQWNDRLMDAALIDLDADYLEVESWFYPDDAAYHAAELTTLRSALARAEEREAGLREALAWYQEQTAGCRKLGREGDPARNALDRDGGERARAALALRPQSPAPTEPQGVE